MVRHSQRKGPGAAVSSLILVFNEPRSFCTLNSSQNWRWECRNQGEKWEWMDVGWKWAGPHQSCREAIFHEQRPLALPTLKERMTSFQMCHSLSEFYLVSLIQHLFSFILEKFEIWQWMKKENFINVRRQSCAQSIFIPLSGARLHPCLQLPLSRAGMYLQWVNGTGEEQTTGSSAVYQDHLKLKDLPDGWDSQGMASRRMQAPCFPHPHLPVEGSVASCQGKAQNEGPQSWPAIHTFK